MFDLISVVSYKYIEKIFVHAKFKLYKTVKSLNPGVIS